MASGNGAAVEAESHIGIPWQVWGLHRVGRVGDLAGVGLGSPPRPLPLQSHASHQCTPCRYRRFSRWKQTSHAEAVEAERSLLGLLK